MGLPLIGRADWNDCLNLNCFSNDPTSLSRLTENKTEGSKSRICYDCRLFVVYGRDYVELCKKLHKADEANRAQKLVDNMVESY